MGMAVRAAGARRIRIYRCMTASTRPSDAGGPRPENQRKRAEIRGPRQALIGMLAVVAIGAIAVLVLRRSDASFLGLPPDYLAGSSGLVPAVLIAGSHAAAAALLALHSPRARVGAAIAAFLMIASSVVVIVSMLGVAWVPALMFFIGFVELLLVAGSTPRKPARRNHAPGR